MLIRTHHDVISWFTFHQLYIVLSPRKWHGHCGHKPIYNLNTCLICYIPVDFCMISQQYWYAVLLLCYPVITSADCRVYIVAASQTVELVYHSMSCLMTEACSLTSLDLDCIPSVLEFCRSQYTTLWYS